MGLSTSKVLDRGAVELLGPHGLSQTLYNSSLGPLSGPSTASTGSISSYGLFIFIGAISLTLLLFAPFFGVDSVVSSLGDIRVVLLYGAAFFYIGAATLTPTPQ